MKKHKTIEEKIANTIGHLVSDLRLDLDLIGHYLAWYAPNVVYRRFLLIAEAAREERESRE
jgi:hypothetical protein